MGTALSYSASTAAAGVRVGLSHRHIDIMMLKLVVLRQRLPRQPHDTLSGKSYWRNQKFFDTQNFGERSDLTCLEKHSNSGFSGMYHCVGPSVGLRFVGFLSILGSCDRVHIHSGMCDWSQRLQYTATWVLPIRAWRQVMTAGSRGTHFGMHVDSCIQVHRLQQRSTFANIRLSGNIRTNLLLFHS